MSKNSSIKDYITFTRDLEGYKWYKPLLTIILSFIFYMIFTLIIMLILEGTPGLNHAALLSSKYESLNATSIEGLSNFLYIVIIIPSIFLASKITRDRPFSTYLTSREKWNWELFLKSFLIGAVILILFTILPEVIHGTKIKITFTIVTFILAIILIPLQCFSEELAFRGLFMQSFGAWFKIPILAIILQSIIFMLGHPYNLLGQIGILVTGICYGLIAWKMDGLEVSSGMHTANNLLLMLAMGFFQVDAVPTNVSLIGAISDIALVIGTTAVILIIYYKTNWLNAE